MKKLMIGLVGALAMYAGAEVASENIVGYKNMNITAGYRAMRSAATFLKTGNNPLAIKISDVRQISGDPGELMLCTYNDNVTRLARFMYFSEEVAAEVGSDMELELGEGWYVLDESSGDPDFEVGVQDVDLPYGQGCVIISGSSSAEYVSAGEVDSISREFKIPAGSRKMMGNVLPRSIMLSELKQTVGDPGEHIFCTYDNNVTRLNRYMYFADEVAEELEVASGWYVLDEEGDPDFDAGAQDFEIAAGQGFVVNSGSSNAVLQFPKAM